VIQELNRSIDSVISEANKLKKTLNQNRVSSSKLGPRTNLTNSLTSCVSKLKSIETVISNASLTSQKKVKLSPEELKKRQILSAKALLIKEGLITNVEANDPCDSSGSGESED